MQRATRITCETEVKYEVAVKSEGGIMRFAHPQKIVQRVLPDDGLVEPEGSRGRSMMCATDEFGNNRSAVA